MGLRLIDRLIHNYYRNHTLFKRCSKPFAFSWQNIIKKSIIIFFIVCKNTFKAQNWQQNDYETFLNCKDIFNNKSHRLQTTGVFLRLFWFRNNFLSILFCFGSAQYFLCPTCNLKWEVIETWLFWSEKRVWNGKYIHESIDVTGSPAGLNMILVHLFKQFKGKLSDSLNTTLGCDTYK